MKKIICSCLITFSFWSIAQAQNNIKTVQLRPLGKNNFNTIVPLGTVLELSFDDLDGDQKEYSYKIEHMNFQWKPSNMLSNEYIVGFDQNTILNFENSFNTLQNYTHYKVRIPNQNTQITKSGNYLLSVLDDAENVIFKRQFTLYKSKSTVGVSVIRGRNTLNANEQQTVQFTVNYNANQIQNPGQEIQIALLQNNIWETAITNLTPQFFKKNQLVYSYFNKSNFWGGNEYFNFDNKQLRNSTLQIERVARKEVFHSYLYAQRKRNLLPYTYFPDINGQFVVRTMEGNISDTEADYARIHFSLKSNRPLRNTVFVYGAFNNFKTTEETKMIHNPSTGFYTTSFLLKQGFYNYTFVTKNESAQINRHELNGSFFQTENEYTVLVYYTPFGQNYTEVIGVGFGAFNQDE